MTTYCGSSDSIILSTQVNRILSVLIEDSLFIEKEFQGFVLLLRFRIRKKAANQFVTGVKTNPFPPSEPDAPFGRVEPSRQAWLEVPQSRDCGRKFDAHYGNPTSPPGPGAPGVNSHGELYAPFGRVSSMLI